MCRRFRRSIVAESLMRRAGRSSLRVLPPGRSSPGCSVSARKTSSRSGEWIERGSTLSDASRSSRSSTSAAIGRRRRSGPEASSASSSRVDPSSSRAAGVKALDVGELQPDVAAGHEPLELVGRALGDQPPVVEDRDAVGELVGLVQVLRGEEDRDAVGHQAADDVPHGAAAARVETRGRLVEEDDPRVADQGHREVEPALHPSGVVGDRLRGRVDEVELLQQFGDRAGLPPVRGGADRPSA